MQILKQTEHGITTKLLVNFHDGLASEVVAVRRPTKSIICFSTMIGCPVGCQFCWSGVVDDYRRPLTSEEMIGLIRMARVHLPEAPIVFSAMGEGEPALNADQVLLAFSGLDLRPGDKLAISTAGPNMRAVDHLLEACLSSIMPIKVQYSLHASKMDRQKLMRGAKADPSDVLRALKSYEQLRPDMVELNIVPMQGVNTDPDQYAGLISMLQDVAPGHPWQLKINRHNPVAPSAIIAASSSETDLMIEAFRNSGMAVEWYQTDGNAIEAACGQLHYQSNHSNNH